MPPVESELARRGGSLSAPKFRRLPILGDLRSRLGQFIHQPIAVEDSESQTCFFFFWSDDFPGIASRRQTHLTSGPPPVVDLRWKGSPNFFIFNQLSQISEQRFINSARASLNQIIRMGNKAHQPVSLTQERQLLLPKIYRIVVENMEERIILGGGERQLDYFTDKVRHHRAASASHGFKMSDIGDRHIIRKFEDVVPILIPIHGPRAKTLAIVFAHVFINFSSAPDKFVAFAV